MHDKKVMHRNIKPQVQKYKIITNVIVVHNSDEPNLASYCNDQIFRIHRNNYYIFLIIQNIFLTKNGQIKLGNFGISKISQRLVTHIHG